MREIIVFILVVLLIVLLIIGIIPSSNIQNNPKKKYEESLQALKNDPTNADLRQETLRLGRVYSNWMRNKKGRTIFDEVAIMNDINAVCASTHTIIQKLVPPPNKKEEENKPQTTEQQKPTPILNPQHFIADEIKKLADLHSSGILTLEEFQQQKAKLLDIVDIPKPKEPAQIKPETKVCSKCNIPMQVKTVTKGEQQGKQFYVCSNYPTCREVYKFET